MEDNVIGLPFPGFAAGIHQWGGYPIKGPSLAIEVGLVLIRIKNLDFIAALQISPAVASALSLSLHFAGRSPLDVHLHIPNLLFADNIPCAVALRYAAFHFPFSFPSGEPFPL